jgi:hypothetical protein
MTADLDHEPDADGANMLHPDRRIAEAFVSAFTAHDRTPGVIRLRFLHDRERRAKSIERDGTVAGVWPDLVKFQRDGYGAYYFLNEVPPARGSGYEGMATDGDVIRVRALGIDCDNGMPETWTYYVLPDFIVHTSIKDGVQRGQALWLVSDCPSARFKELQQRLSAHYGTDRQVSNLSRVFRLPGSLHQKREPSLVTFEKKDFKPC